MRVSRITSVIGRVFGVGAIAWACALPASAWAEGAAYTRPILVATAAIVYAIGSVICHQLPERSFHLAGVQLPVCARCTGIYVGAALAAAALLVASARPRRIVDAARATRAWMSAAPTARVVLAIAAAPTAATLIWEWSTGVAPSNTMRALAGFPLGAAAAAIVLSALDNQVN